MKTAMMMNPTTKSIAFVCVATLLLLLLSSAPSTDAELLRSRAMSETMIKNEEEGSVLLPPELIDTMIGKALLDQGRSVEDFLFDEAWEWSDLNYTAEDEEEINFINDGLPEGVDLNDYNLTFIDEVTGEEIKDHRHLVSVSTNEYNNARYVNLERKNRKIKGLSWNTDGITEAQKWSKYMCSSGVFQHREPLSEGISGNWMRISENIAMNMKVTQTGGAHSALMNSDGHRKNILDTKVNQFGIGICRSPKKWYYVTQIFTQIV